MWAVEKNQIIWLTLTTTSPPLYHSSYWCQYGTYYTLYSAYDILHNICHCTARKRVTVERTLCTMEGLLIWAVYGRERIIGSALDQASHIHSTMEPFKVYNAELTKTGTTKAVALPFFNFFFTFCPVLGYSFSSACAKLVWTKHSWFDHLVALYTLF